jgi:hypothetical protein
MTPMNRPEVYNIYCPSNRLEAVKTAKAVYLRDKNDVILSDDKRKVVKNEKLRKILHRVLLLGSPQYGQQFRVEMEKENRDRQFEIAEAMLQEIRKSKDPPVR